MTETLKNGSFKKYSAFTILFSMLMFAVCCVMKIDINNVLLPILVESGWDRGVIMGATSIGGFIAIAVGFVGGTIAMKKGIKCVSLIGQVIMLVGTLLMAFSKNAGGVGLAFAICSIAYPLYTLSATTYITKWFVKRRGWALGVVTMALPIMSAIYLPVGSSIIATHGKTGFYFVVAIIIALMIVYEIAVLRENPEDRACSPDGIAITDEQKKSIEAMTQETGAISTKVLFSKKESWFLIIGSTLIRFGMVCLMSVFVLRMVDVGIARTTATIVMSVATLVGIPFSYFWGVLDDKVGTNKAITIFSITYVVGFFLVLIMNASNMILIFLTCAFVASTTGGTENLKQSIISFVYGRKYFVQGNRYVSLFADLGSAFAYSFMMSMYASFGTYNQAYIVLIVLSVIMTVMFALIRQTFDPERKELIGKK